MGQERLRALSYHPSQIAQVNTLSLHPHLFRGVIYVNSRSEHNRVKFQATIWHNVTSSTVLRGNAAHYTPYRAQTAV